MDERQSREDELEEETLDLHHDIAERYLEQGIELLSDALPSHIDPALAARLEGLVGDVKSVRVHTGKAATEAARSMDARAFAVGDQDIFVDEAEHNPGTARGQALLAHEAAHTQDASAGFALSSRSNPSGDSREAYAQDVERAFAREEEAEAAPLSVPERAERSAPAPDEQDREAEVDKVALAQRIKEILSERERFERDRYGR
jgi:hypothetical protein